MESHKTKQRRWRPSPWMEEGHVAGGFVLVRTAPLMACWQAYKAGRVKLCDVRAWLGIIEMVHRREASTSKREPFYQSEEIARLTGTPDCRSSVRRLSKAGLIRWSPEQVRVSGSPGNQTTRRKLIPMPRRVVRWLARHGTAAEIAAAFGHASRCLFYDSKLKKCRSGGHCTAMWVAEHFEIGERSVKRARSAWVDRGWLRVVDDGRAGYRRGARFIVELAWDCPQKTRDRMAPQDGRSRTRMAPPRDQQDPPSEIKQPDRNSGPYGQACLSRIVPEDLNDASRLAELHRQAGRQGFVPKSQAGALLVFSAASRAKRCADRNACGMFATIVQNGLWGHITSIDEDAARHLFKQRPVVNTDAPGSPPLRNRSPETREQVRALVRSAMS